MSKKGAKIKEYTQAGITLIICVISLFIFDLPKTSSLITLIITAALIIFLHEVFEIERKENSRKKEYLISIIMFIIFSIVIFVFDVPKKVYAFIGIIFGSNIVLYEVFNWKSGKKSNGG